MFGFTRITIFLTAALLLAIAPGPGMLYVLARSLAGGRREGVLSAFGTFLGGMVHVFAAALGLSGYRFSRAKLKPCIRIRFPGWS